MSELENIHAFIATVETGNMAHAAKRVHITKSVLSRRISSLEANLGVQLFTRSTKGVTPTDAGNQYYERIKNIVAELEDAKECLSTDKQEIKGTIRLTAPEAYSRMFLTPLFIETMRNNPDLSLETNFTDRLTDIAAEGYDLAVRIGNPTSNSLIGRRIRDINILTVASPDYLRKFGEPLKPQDLSRHQCITYTNAAMPNQWHYNHQGKDISVKVPTILQSDSGDLMTQAAIAGLGILSIPDFFVSDALAQGLLVPILGDFTSPSLGLYILYPEKRHMKSSVRLLIDRLIQHCSLS